MINNITISNNIIYKAPFFYIKKAPFVYVYRLPILYIPRPRPISNEPPSILKHLLIGLSVGYPSAIAHKISYLINYYK
jgi:hypothetical protein